MLGHSLSVMQIQHAQPRPAPAAFAPQDWQLIDAAAGGTLIVRTLRLPDDGGVRLTGLEISLDGGDWRALGDAVVGDFVLSGLVDHVETSARLRAVSAAGAGAAGAPVSATPTPLPLAPSALSAPGISGAPVVGATLVATGGVWVGEPAPTLAWVWRRDGVAIPSAQGPEYRVAPEDEDRDIDVQVTAANAAGTASAVAPAIRIAVRFPILTRAIPAQEAVLGGWWGLDLSEHASAGAPLSFALVDGALPAGVRLDAQTGMLHGVPLEGGARALSFEARTPTGASTLRASLAVRRTTTLVSGGGLTRSAALGLPEGAGLRRRMTLAARFRLPAGWSTATTLFHILGRSQVRVFSNGQLSINIQQAGAAVDLAAWVSATDATVNDGLEHLLVIAVDLSDGAPSMTVTLDGLPMRGAFTVAPVAGEMAVNRNGYGIGCRNDGSAAWPAGGALRWVYVGFDQATPAAAFADAPDPRSIGAPTLFFGGLAANWSGGVNHGALGGVFTPVGTFVALEAEAAPDPRPLAFPGAVGHGRFTTGGRFDSSGEPGAVIRITSSADTGPGSLREALLTPGARTIIIEARAPIWLESGPIDIPNTHGNLTIDARRAPNFFLSMARIRVRPSNVLVRGLRMYSGGEAGQTPTRPVIGAFPSTTNQSGQPEAYWEFGDTRGEVQESRHCVYLGDYTNQSSSWTGLKQSRVYFDRCEFAWAPDKCVSIFPLTQSFAPNYTDPEPPCGDITFDGCLAFESLYASGVASDYEEMSSLLFLIGEHCARITLHGNLFATATNRFPATNKYCRQIDLVNSWNANWGQNGTQLAGNYNEALVINPASDPAGYAAIVDAQAQMNIVRCVYDEGGATQNRPGGRAPINMIADVPGALCVQDVTWNAPNGAPILANPVRLNLNTRNAANVLNGAPVNVSPTPVSALSATPLPAETDLRAWVAARAGARNPDGSLHPIAARIVAQALARTLPSWSNQASAGWPETTSVAHVRGGPRGQWKVDPWAIETTTPGQNRLDRPDDAHLIYSPNGALRAAVP